MDCHASGMDARNDNSESGRSLVEMLGVLAVMGILTIGGIAGFNYAMNKQRANATVNYVNQLAIEGSRQMLAGSNHLSLLDYPDKTPSGYGVELGLLKDTNAYFEVYVKDVPEAVCSQIQAMAEGWRGLDTLWVNEDGKDCNKETNTMSFIFTDSLSRGTSGTRCTENSNCSGCQTCQRGFCTDTDSACLGDTPHCVSGSCETCPAGEFQDNKGKCYDCGGDNTIEGVDTEECGKCFGKRFYYTAYKRCIPCSSTLPWHYSADKNSCLACSHRYFLPSGSENKELGTCPFCNGKVVTDEKGEPTCQGDCPAGQIWSQNGCVDCDDASERFYSVLRQTCRSECDGLRFPSIDYNECLRCDSLAAPYVLREDCVACPNRYIYSKDTYGLCYFCDGEVISDTSGRQVCHAECPDGQVWAGSQCVPCDSSDKVLNPVYAPDCARQCKGIRFARPGFSQCIRCDYADTLYYSDQESCLACGNRTIAGVGDICRPCAGTVSEDGKTCITE